MTVSECVFIPDAGMGECECCHRKPVQLGHCNALPTDDVRCIDCFFGPPPESYVDFLDEEEWYDPAIDYDEWDDYDEQDAEDWEDVCEERAPEDLR